MIFTESVRYSCQSHWTLYEDTCIRRFGASLNFYDFLDRCHKYDSKPVSIKSLAKEAAITTLLRPYREYWIGLFNPINDNNRNHFRWVVDNTLLLQVNYSNWYYTEPSHDGPCIVISKKNSVWKWYDRKCDYRYNFICQKGN